MKFNCPSCNQRIQCDDGLAGRHERCPNCNTRIAIPEAETPAADPGDAAAPAPKKGAAAAKVVRVKRQPRASLHRSTSISAGPNGTNVPAFATAALGLGLTAAFYLLLFPLRGTTLGALFLERGWVPVAEALLFWWSVAILFFKSKKLAKQKQCMLFDILPEELAPDITQASIGLFIDHARLLKQKAPDSFLVNRALKVLEHFRVRNSNPEAATVLSAQSDVDANAVQSSYTLLRIFIWAIPILGFIGTVRGLGSAVGGFASGLEGAQDIAVLKDSLGRITVGLAVAFDTTLIALIMAIPLMFLASSMQKAEEDVLNAIDEFCTENLLKRLNERRDALAGAAGAPDVLQHLRAVTEQAWEQHRAAWEAWRQELTALGATLRGHVLDGWEEVLKRQHAQYAEQVARVQAAHQEAGAASAATLKDLAAVQEQLAALQRSETERQAALARGADALGEGLAALNRGLARLGEAAVALPAPRPSRWRRLLGQR